MNYSGKHYRISIWNIATNTWLLVWGLHVLIFRETRGKKSQKNITHNFHTSLSLTTYSYTPPFMHKRHQQSTLSYRAPDTHFSIPLYHADYRRSLMWNAVRRPPACVRRESAVYKCVSTQNTFDHDGSGIDESLLPFATRVCRTFAAEATSPSHSWPRK